MTLTVVSFPVANAQSNNNVNATWTVPAGVTTITGLVVGGGGGGGRSNATTTQATLNQDVTSATQTTIRCNGTVASWPVPGVAQFSDNGEQVYYTSITGGNTLAGCTRGYNGTTATNHSSTVPAPNQTRLTLLDYVDGAGGGGGGGGQVSYNNAISVTPGEVLSITTGFGGLASGANLGDGGFSEISRGGLVSAGGTSILKGVGGFGAGTTINGGASGAGPAGAAGSGLVSPNPATCIVRGGGGGGSNTTSGGAGEVPSAVNTKTGGTGGAGTTYTLINSYTLGGGGGGGSSYSAASGGIGGAGGSGGGGNGGVDSAGSNGSPGTGGGGGGVGRNPQATTVIAGGRGGTGMVYIMYDSVAVTYSVSPSSGVTVDGQGNLFAAEGDTVTFNVSTTGVANNTTLYWGINSQASTSTLSAADFTTSSGSFTVTGTVTGATGTFSVPIALDTNQTEVESFSIGIALSQADLGNPFANPVVAANFVAVIAAPITITNPVPTYSLTAGAPSNNPAGNILTNGLDEGATVQFTFSLTNYAPNTVFLWSITGNSGDFPAASGTVINNQGIFTSSFGTFTIGPTADFTTEPSAETFTVIVKDPTGTTTLASVGPITINDTTIGTSPNKYWYGLRTDGTYADFTGTAGELRVEANLTNKLSGQLYAGQYVTIVGIPGVQNTTSNVSTVSNAINLATAFGSTPAVGSKITFHGAAVVTGGFATYYSGKTYYVYSSSSPSSFTLTETAPVAGSVWTCTQIAGTISGTGMVVAQALSGLIVSPNSTAATVDAASPAQGTIVMPARRAADTINPYSSYAYTATYKIEADPVVSGNFLNVKLIQLTGQVAPVSTAGKLNGLTLHFSSEWDTIGTNRSRWFSQTNGGGALTTPPANTENAIFDANSGEGVVLVNNTACTCASLLMTGSLQTSSSKVILAGVSATTSVITITESAYLTPYGSSRDTRFTPKLKFASRVSGQTLTSGDFEPNGFLCGDIEIDKHLSGSLATLTLLGDLTTQQTSTLTMTGGIFVANGKNVTVGKYLSNSTTAAGQARVQMGTGLWTTTYDSTTGSDATWDSGNTAVEFQTITSTDNNVKMAQSKGVTAVATDITTTLPTMVQYGANALSSYIEVTDANDLPNNSELLIDNEFFKYDSWDITYRPARVFITSRGETLTGITSTVAAHSKKTAVVECSAAAGAALTGMSQSYLTTQIFGLNAISTDGEFSCFLANLTTGSPGAANTTNQPPNSLILVTGGAGTAGNAIISTGTAPYSNTGTTYMVTQITGGSPGAVTSFKMQLVSYAQNAISVTPITTTINGTTGYTATTADLRFGTNIGVLFKGATGGTMKIDDETVTYLPGSANAGANVFRITGRGITDPVSNRTSNALPHSLVSPVSVTLAQPNIVAVIATLGTTDWNAVAGTTGVVYTANTVITIKNPSLGGGSPAGTIWPANAFQVAYRKFNANSLQTFNKLILSSYGTLVHTYFTGGATIKSFTNLIPSLTNTIYPAAQELYFNTSSSYKFNSFDFTGSATYIQKIYGYPLVSSKPVLTKLGVDNWWDVGLNCTLNSTTGVNNQQTIYKTSTATVDHISFNYVQGSPIDPARASGYGANFFLTLKD